MKLQRYFDYFATAERRPLILAAAPWLVAVLGFAVAFETASSASDAEIRITEALAKTPPATSIEVTPLAQTEYATIAATVAITHPSADIHADSRGVEIRTDNMGAFDEFLATVEAFPATQPQLRWRITDLCIGEKCSSAGFKATITAESARILAKP